MVYVLAKTNRVTIQWHGNYTGTWYHMYNTTRNIFAMNNHVASVLYNTTHCLVRVRDGVSGRTLIGPCI